jgi:hypothetical protein
MRPLAGCGCFADSYIVLSRKPGEPKTASIEDGLGYGRFALESDPLNHSKNELKVGFVGRVASHTQR